jgi:hypothetical protein
MRIHGMQINSILALCHSCLTPSETIKNSKWAELDMPGEDEYESCDSSAFNGIFCFVT